MFGEAETTVVGKPFGSVDFPPALSLQNALKKEKLPYKDVVGVMETVLNGADGSNTNPLLLEAFVEYVRKGKSFTDYVADTPVLFTNREEQEYYLTTNLFTQDIISVVEKFGVSKPTFIDWVNVFIKNSETLTMEDAYYVAAFHSQISVPAYNMFLNASQPEWLTETGRIKPTLLLKYFTIQAGLRQTPDIQFNGRDVYMLTENYTLEDLITLIKLGYSLTDVTVYNKLGMFSVEDINANAGNIPEEWFNLIK